MSSTRKILGVAVLPGLMALGLSGCVRSEDWPSEPPQVILQATPEPVPHDEAMDLRVWDRSSVVYADGGVVGGPTGVRYRLRDDAPAWQQVVLEPLLFIGQGVLAPVFYLTEPLTQVHSGADTPPTHYAVPPVMAEEW